MWRWAQEHTPKAEDRAQLRESLERVERAGRQPPVTIEDRGRPHHPATTPPGIPVPSWYKGDKAAFASSVQAARDLGEHVGA